MNLEKLTRDYGDIVWAGKKCYCGLPISFTTYILTETKLITRIGLINLQEDELELYRVIDKAASYPLNERMFGCGTIKLTSKDSDSPVKLLQSIKNPREVKRILEELIEKQRSQYHVRGRDMYGVAGIDEGDD